MRNTTVHLPLRYASVENDAVRFVLSWSDFSTAYGHVRPQRGHLFLYLHDITVFSHSSEQHLEQLELVLRRMKAFLTLKPSKCNLLQKSVRFLGLIEHWPAPRGLSGYYMRFVKDCTKIAAPLNALRKAGRNFEWTPSCQTAFGRLKTALVSPPVLAILNENDTFVPDTDASDRAIGAVLSQVQNEHERVIAYGGRSLSRSEINYCITRKELLSMVYLWAITVSIYLVVNSRLG